MSDSKLSLRRHRARYGFNDDMHILTASSALNLYNRQLETDELKLRTCRSKKTWREEILGKKLVEKMSF